jgi:hypothetical protein
MSITTSPLALDDIGRAVNEADGDNTQAAALLGLRSRQTLATPE